MSLSTIDSNSANNANKLWTVYHNIYKVKPVLIQEVKKKGDLLKQVIA
jgi:hypothetical protein